MVLLRLGDPAAVRLAISLLERAIEDWPQAVRLALGQHQEVPRSHELLGEAYAKLGDLPAAEHHYRQCLAKADANRNGISDGVEVFLAEVLLRKGDAASIAEAANLLAAPRLARMLLWQSHIFRFYLAKARLRKLQGGEPSEWAAKALEVAADTRPQLARHPNIGLVAVDDATLSELKSYIGQSATKWS